MSKAEVLFYISFKILKSPHYKITKTKLSDKNNISNAHQTQVDGHINPVGDDLLLKAQNILYHVNQQGEVE